MRLSSAAAATLMSRIASQCSLPLASHQCDAAHDRSSETVYNTTMAFNTETHRHDHHENKVTNVERPHLVNELQLVKEFD